MTLKLHGVISTAFVIGAVIAASNARADLVLDFSVAGGSSTSVDAPGNNDVATVPVTTISGIELTGMSSSDASGFPTESFLDTNIGLINTNNTNTTVTITAAQRGFFLPTAPPLSLTNSIMGQVSGGFLTYTFNGCADPTDSGTACGPNALHPTALSASNFTTVVNGTDSQLITSSLAAGYSLSDTVTVTLTPGVQVDLQETTDIAPAPAPTTPLPATLPLFATGLGALGLFGWRRKRKARVSLLGAA